jgi:hypothetical protein
MQDIDMEITTFFIITASLLLIVVFFPDLFPRCSNCKKIKPRFMFRIHKNVSLRLGYKANRSVCKKCCRKYDLYTLNEYERYESLREKVAYRLKNKL